MLVEGFFEPLTCTISYLVLDRNSRQCAIIDSVLDYDSRSGRISTASADALITRVAELDAQVEWILETHVHADHLSAAPYLKERLGGRIGISEHIITVQKTFGKFFNAGTEFALDGSQFDHLFVDSEEFAIGGIMGRAVYTPGHTPACMVYIVSNGAETGAFVGDTLFMPDYGTARADFPGGDARALYRSINKILSLPATTKLYMCHDYQPGGRQVRFISTVAEQREKNIHVRDEVNEEEFVTMRLARDATLEMPILFLPSVQVNMRAGNFPEPEENGQRYLKIPLNTP